MERRMYHMPRIGGARPERRKRLFDRRDHGVVVRFLYGCTMLPLGRLLHSLSGGRIPIRSSRG